MPMGKRGILTAMDLAIQQFISTLSKQRNSSINTLGAYRTDLTQLMRFLQKAGITTWEQARPSDIAAFVDDLRQSNYAATSVARKIAALKSFFHFLMQSGAIMVDVAGTVGAPRLEKQLPSVLSPDDVNRLLGAVKVDSPTGQRDLAMLHCLYSTGMRVSELVALDVASLNLARGDVQCHGRNQRRRTLPLSPLAQRALAQYLGEGRRALIHEDHASPLFVNHHGHRLTRQGFWLIMKQYARLAGIENITPHTLRHSFALDMLSQGMDLRSVQVLLGHRNISTTQVYAHLQRAQPASMVSVLDDLIALSNTAHETDGMGEMPRESDDTASDGAPALTPTVTRL